MKFIILPFYLALVTVASAHAEVGAWKQYVNERFGFSLKYPAPLVASPDPVDGAGREYHTPDHEFSVATAAHFLRIVDSNESLESHWQEELKDLKNQISYKTKGASWYVVSGVTTNGQVFYHKFFTKGNNWATFHITYPKSKKAKYDSWVTRIAIHFVPFLKGKNYDRSDWNGIRRAS